MRAEVRQAIVDDLRAGKSQYSTAKRHGINQGTVSKIAKAEGIDGIYAPPKNAARARHARAVYDLEQRMGLSDRAFEVLESELGNTPLKDWSISYAVLVDKRRLEEGKATERHEHVDSARDDVTRRVDELAARRRTRGLVRESDQSASEGVGA